MVNEKVVRIDLNGYYLQNQKIRKIKAYFRFTEKDQISIFCCAKQTIKNKFRGLICTEGFFSHHPFTKKGGLMSKVQHFVLIKRGWARAKCAKYLLSLDALS